MLNSYIKIIYKTANIPIKLAFLLKCTFFSKNTQNVIVLGKRGNERLSERRQRNQKARPGREDSESDCFSSIDRNN